MAIMETNIGHEPICHRHEIINKNKTVNVQSLFEWDQVVPCPEGGEAEAVPRSLDGYRILILQLMVDSKGLVTMFNPCLMDLSYLILKETTANNRTVRTQHILEKSS